jgi:protein-disulfide isomerase
VLAIALALGGSLILASQIGARDAEQPAPSANRVAAPLPLFAGIRQRGAVLGSPMARVTLVEYADVQCPYCAEWARRTLPYVVDRYVRTGRVRLVFRGLAFLGSDSVLGLRAVVAAGEQNKLWPLLEELYERQGYENSGWVGEQLDDAVAAVPGLDQRRLDRVANSAATARALARNAHAAQLAGVGGTPSFQIGPTSGALRLIKLQSLGPEGIAPALDASLAR